MAGKFRRALDEIIETKLAPYKNMLGGPKRVTVVSFANGRGKGSGKNGEDISLQGSQNIKPGMVVIAVPVPGEMAYQIAGVV